MKKTKYLFLSIVPLMASPLITICSCSNGEVKITSIEAKLKKEPIIGQTIYKDDIEVSAIKSDKTKEVVNDWTTNVNLPLVIMTENQIEFGIQYQTFKTSLYLNPILPENAMRITFVSAEGGYISGYNVIYAKKGTAFGNLEFRPSAVAKSGYSFDKWETGGKEADIYTTFDQNTTITAKFKEIPVTAEGGLKFTPHYNTEGALDGYKVGIDANNIDKLDVKENGEYYIPATHTGETGGALPVIAIADSMFEGRRNSTKFEQIKHVHIPAHVKTIGNKAFYRDLKEYTDTSTQEKYYMKNTNLEKVTFDGEELDTIFFWAFGNNVNLKSVALPKNLKYIDADAFNMTEAIEAGLDPLLQSVTFNNVDDQELNIEQNAFKGCKKIETVTFYEGLKRIAGFNQTGLKSVTLPSSVTKVDEYGFSDNEFLKSVTFGKPTITSEKEWNSKGLLIGNHAFENTAIESIDISYITYTIGNYAFANSALSSITFDKHATYGQKIATLSEHSFENIQIQSIDIPDSVINICNYSFNNCYKLANVNFSESTKVQRIGVAGGLCSVFGGCPEIKSFTIPSTVIYIGYNIFGKWDESGPTTNLESLTFKDTTKSWKIGYQTEAETFTPTEDSSANATNFLIANNKGVMNKITE